MAELVKCEAGIGLCGAEFAVTPKSDLRDELRLPINRHGWLTSGDALLPCLIENMSTQGFFIMSNTTFPVGAVVGLRCELYPNRFLQCGIEIVHVTDSCMGAKIVEINANALNLCRLFIEENYFLCMMTRPPRTNDDSQSDELE